MRLPAPRGALQLEDVVVWPPGCSEPTLRKVSFALAPGEVLGVVGSSGSGKSTLARVAIGAWRPYSGKVRLDGAEIESYGRDEIGPYLGYLPQEVELFEGTVAENIARFGELDAVSVVEAARRAGVHEMILGLPDGYETQLGPQGCVLSGGQRQRIGLARALYRSPVLVVLDEPNANLDSAGEDALIGAVQTLKSLGSTVILVSHRPKVLRDVDYLLLLKSGVPALMRSRIRPAARHLERAEDAPALGRSTMSNILPFSAPPLPKREPPPYPTDLRPVLLCGWLVIGGVFGGFGTWAAFAPLSSAAIAPGIVVVDSNRKSVQHLEGGVIREILVRDGDVVEQSQVLLRLDGASVRAAMAALQPMLQTNRAYRARLLAERDGLPDHRFPGRPARATPRPTRWPSRSWPASAGSSSPGTTP